MKNVLIVFTVLLLPVITIQDHQDVYHNHFAVHVKGGLEAANRIAQRYGFENSGQIGSLEDHYLFQHHRVHKRSITLSHSHHDLLREEPEVLWFEQQKQLKRVKRDKTIKNKKQVNDNKIKDSIHTMLLPMKIKDQLVGILHIGNCVLNSLFLNHQALAEKTLDF